MVNVVNIGLSVDSREVKKGAKSLKNLGNQARKTEKATDKMSRGFKGFGSALAAIGFAVAIKNIIEISAVFEKLAASLETVTGSTDKAVQAMEGIKAFASSTPFQVQEITDAFIKLKSLGIAPTERGLLSFGNTASAMGKSLNQFIEAVADASTNEFERLKEFGIKARQQGDEVAFTFQGVTTKIKKNSEDITGYLTSLGETKFAGAMEKQMDTLDGAFSNFSDSVDNAVSTLAKDSGFNALVKSATLGVSLFIRELTGTQSISDFDLKLKGLNAELKEAEERFNNRSIFRFGRSAGAAGIKIKNLKNEIKELNALKSAAVEKVGGGIDAAGKESPEEAAAKAQVASDLLFEIETDRLFLQIELDDQKLTQQLEFNDRTKTLTKERLEAEAVLEKAANDSKYAATKTFFGNMSTLMGSTSKKQFEIGKKFALANALIKGYEAIVSAYAAGAKIHPLVGAAFAAAAALATNVQIQAIKSQQFGGGGGVSVSTGAGGGVTTGTNFNGGAPQQNQNAGGVTTINLVGDDKTFTTEQVDVLFDEIGNALERGDRVLFSSNSRQALELSA